VARIALRPVQRLGKAIELVREGEAENITGEYPSEIAPLADEVNELLRSNAQIIERAKNQVGNLAHGLKTPIAVLRNEASADRDNPLAHGFVGNREDAADGDHLSRPGAAYRRAAPWWARRPTASTSCCGWCG
jgi:signal transduction histidine kinase